VKDPEFSGGSTKPGRLQTTKGGEVGRKSATVEFLGKLVEFAGSRAEFSKRTGILQPNLAAYLNGTKTISWARLEKAAERLFGEPPAFVPIVEGRDLRAHPSLTILPRDPGIYGLFDSTMRLIYYGKATNLRAEVAQTLGRRLGEVRPWTGAKNLTFKQVAAFLSAYEIVRGDPSFRHDVEALGLRLFVNNTFNKNGASFKRTS
jgi:hypothetical protein